jgi:hypothetical protein
VTVVDGARAVGSLCLGSGGCGCWSDFGEFVGLIGTTRCCEAKRANTALFGRHIVQGRRGIDIFDIQFERVVEHAHIVSLAQHSAVSATSANVRKYIIFRNTPDHIIDIPSSYTRAHICTLSPSISSSQYYTYRVVKCVVILICGAHRSAIKSLKEKNYPC